MYNSLALSAYMFRGHISQLFCLSFRKKSMSMFLTWCSHWIQFHTMNSCANMLVPFLYNIVCFAHFDWSREIRKSIVKAYWIVAWKRISAILSPIWLIGSLILHYFVSLPYIKSFNIIKSLSPILFPSECVFIQTAFSNIVLCFNSDYIK